MTRVSSSAFALLALTGCVADDRIPLADCDFGAYWADCGGNGDPVVGCERTSGDCRWFAGGIAARDHVVSDCPVTDVCCHDNWPFQDYAPSGETLQRARGSMAMVREGVLSREGVGDVDVVVDLEGGSRTLTMQCLGGGPSTFPCDEMGSGGFLERVGSSVLVVFDRGYYRFELEIALGATVDDWSVNLYHSRLWMRDPPPVLSCNNYRVGTEWGVTGVLHVNTTDLTNLDAFHGRLEGESDGGLFAMEF